MATLKRIDLIKARTKKDDEPNYDRIKSRDESSMKKLISLKEDDLLRASEAVEDYLAQPGNTLGSDEFMNLVRHRDKIQADVTLLEKIKAEYM